jgi:hypothetical protein
LKKGTPRQNPGVLAKNPDKTFNWNSEISYAEPKPLKALSIIFGSLMKTNTRFENGAHFRSHY